MGLGLGISRLVLSDDGRRRRHGDGQLFRQQGDLRLKAAIGLLEPFVVDPKAHVLHDDLVLIRLQHLDFPVHLGRFDGRAALPVSSGRRRGMQCLPEGRD